MKPAEVRALRRAHRFSAGDLYSTEDLPAFVDREAALPRISEHCCEIAGLLGRLPEFAAACGYRWASDPESYDVPTDAAFQRRILLMLGKFWIESADKTGLPARMSGIVACQEYVTRYGLFSGRLVASLGFPGARVLSIPASLVEMASWLFAGLRCWSVRELGVDGDAADDGGWTIVATAAQPRPSRPFPHVSAWELIARTLAEEGRDRALTGSNAALLIRERVPELAGPGGDVDPAALPHFDQNATYMAVEFVFAHELGHALSTPGADQGTPFSIPSS